MRPPYRVRIDSPSSKWDKTYQRLELARAHAARALTDLDIRDLIKITIFGQEYVAGEGMREGLFGIYRRQS